MFDFENEIVGFAKENTLHALGLYVLVKFVLKPLITKIKESRAKNTKTIDNNNNTAA